ncbi:polyketide cyclase / dehydrase family protein [Frankia sp. EI5c]|uniref:SRPBCC family protein n=1 Tax=Frankia sp. EI5c TaxID=683316 RepID=UPI0007C2B0AD|nr:SRPBCC family protein [Frankia sp. EI5c]OAA26178.1 polyketide cyclase / dehydrase family protein [Frankia sp. EI5c]
MASVVQESIDVDVPVRAAYNQWTQFESFPNFMEGVESVQQIDDTHTHWRIKVGGNEREFDAAITEQHPDERVAWKSTGGTKHAGVVTFHRLADDATRVTVQMDWEPEGLAEKAGAVIGADERRVKGDLKRFKAFIERRGGQESGGWRGDVPRPDASTTAGGPAGLGSTGQQPASPGSGGLGSTGQPGAGGF